MRRQLLRLSKLSLLEQSFERLDIDRMREQTADYALRFEIERAEHAFRTDPLGDPEAALERHQRLGMVLGIVSGARLTGLRSQTRRQSPVSTENKSLFSHSSSASYNVDGNGSAFASS